MSDRRKDVSDALTEIRTVRSRAESARARLASNGGKSESRRVPAHMQDDEYIDGYTEFYRDQDADEMDALLTEFIEKTSKWAKGPRKSHHRP